MKWWLLGLLTSCAACRSIPPCVTPALQEVRLRWGTQDSLGLTIRGYELTAHAELFQYEAIGDSTLWRRRLGYIDGALYCRLLLQAHRAFQAVPAFYVPADSQHFVEYRSPVALMRAVWNPRYRTHGNEPLWLLYDSLEASRRPLRQPP
ncbi:MAG: hypothetical protein NZ473_04500 [Candidatus Kapabacteria bacterium]|nr:hypothetical protein [Candidatus Kapabacteria bacterium]MCS7169755.1 hypothetical protein [Candidatus Kapabacteria bacterium]MDW7996361.1 hypothetical protein [Bacteroidota bacterium]MDW8224433.1 hypothetical protein [Bacteroidota bacterium]